MHPIKRDRPGWQSTPVATPAASAATNRRRSLTITPPSTAIEAKNSFVAGELQAWREVSVSTDF